MRLVWGEVEPAIQGQVEKAQDGREEDKSDGGGAAEQHFAGRVGAAIWHEHETDPPWSLALGQSRNGSCNRRNAGGSIRVGKVLASGVRTAPGSSIPGSLLTPLANYA